MKRATRWWPATTFSTLGRPGPWFFLILGRPFFDLDFWMDFSWFFDGFSLNGSFCFYDFSILRTSTFRAWFLIEFSMKNKLIRNFDFSEIDLLLGKNDEFKHLCMFFFQWTMIDLFSIFSHRSFIGCSCLFMFFGNSIPRSNFNRKFDGKWFQNGLQNRTTGRPLRPKKRFWVSPLINSGHPVFNLFWASICWCILVAIRRRFSQGFALRRFDRTRVGR